MALMLAAPPAQHAAQKVAEEAPSRGRDPEPRPLWWRFSPATGAAHAPSRTPSRTPSPLPAGATWRQQPPSDQLQVPHVGPHVFTVAWEVPGAPCWTHPGGGWSGTQSTEAESSDGERGGPMSSTTSEQAESGTHNGLALQLIGVPVCFAPGVVMQGSAGDAPPAGEPIRQQQASKSNSAGKRSSKTNGRGQSLADLEAMCDPPPPPVPFQPTIITSIGSVGHPFSCEEACKFTSKSRGCKDAADCTHCHYCIWSRHVSKRKAMKKKHIASLYA